MHRRRTFLINRSFQLRYLLYVGSWIFGLSIFYPLTIHQIFEFFMRYASDQPTAPPPPVLLSTQAEVVKLLILMQVVFLVVTILFSLFISHRIAGPLYKLQKTMLDAADGKLIPRLSFRKSDHFRELADSFNFMIDSFQRKGTIVQSDDIQNTLDRLTAELARADESQKAGLEKAISVIQDQKVSR